MKLEYKKFRSDLKDLVFTGDWVDIRVADVLKKGGDVILGEVLGENYDDFLRPQLPEFAIKAGEDVYIRHGIAIELPAGYEALVRPRGSLFAKTGLIFTSSGVIDEGFKGDNDEWFTTYRATRDVKLGFNDRVAQFRIFKKQPELEFEEVAQLGNPNRGGLGSTGGYHH